MAIEKSNIIYMSTQMKSVVRGVKNVGVVEKIFAFQYIHYIFNDVINT